MKRILLVVVFAFLATTICAAARADEQTVEKSMAFTIRIAGDEAAAEDTVNAMLLVRSLEALGGKIRFDGDTVVIELNLTPEKVDALRLALEHGGFPVAHVVGRVMKPGDVPLSPEGFLGGTYRGGHHERFLLGKKGGGDYDMPDGWHFFGKMPEMPEIKCPHCGKTFRPEIPHMMMPHPPMPPMPAPGGEFKWEAKPGGPMPYGGMMPGMGPMHEDAMKQLQGMREQMEQLRAEQGELWRALEELHMRLGQMHKMDRSKCEDLDDLWRALDRLYLEMEEEDD